MVATSVRDIAEYIVKECQVNIGVPETVSEVMHGFWNVIDDVILNFGVHADKGLWEVEKEYRSWIADQVMNYFNTHAVSGISFKP